MNTYPKESDEFIQFNIQVDGVKVTSGVTVSVTAGRVRPTVWIAPTTLEGEVGVMSGGMTPGLYRGWGKVVSSPETPVVDCGLFRIDG